MIGSTATAVPVNEPPLEAEIREAIAELVRDFHPNEFRSFEVVRTEDGAVIHAWTGTHAVPRITREVYL